MNKKKNSQVQVSEQGTNSGPDVTNHNNGNVGTAAGIVTTVQNKDGGGLEKRKTLNEIMNKDGAASSQRSIKAGAKSGLAGASNIANDMTASAHQLPKQGGGAAHVDN